LIKMKKRAICTQLMPIVANLINGRKIQLGSLVITSLTHVGPPKMIAHVISREGKKYLVQLILLMSALLYMHQALSEK